MTTTASSAAQLTTTRRMTDSSGRSNGSALPIRERSAARVSLTLRRIMGLLAAVVTIAALLSGGANSRTVAPPAVPGGLRAGEVAIFYYPWYGTEPRDGQWQHWQQNGNRPRRRSRPDGSRPEAPTRHPTCRRSRPDARDRGHGDSDRDRLLVGSRSAEAARLPMVSRLAREAGLAGRVARGAVRRADAGDARAGIRRLQSGRNHGLLRLRLDSDGRRRVGRPQRPPLGVRLFAHTSMPGKARAGGFDGLYTYDVLHLRRHVVPAHLCLGTAARPRLRSIGGPGYDAMRATGDPRVRGRAQGRVYDRMWRGAIRAEADVVTVTSYNEWHEGTQIERARNVGTGSLVRGSLRAHRPARHSARISIARRMWVKPLQEHGRTHGAASRAPRRGAAGRSSASGSSGPRRRTAPRRLPADDRDRPRAQEPPRR